MASFIFGSLSSVEFFDGALTPPPGHPFGEPVVITASVDMDSLRNEMIFTFGPHGCQFSSLVEIWLDYSDLNTVSPILYYIDKTVITLNNSLLRLIEAKSG